MKINRKGFTLIELLVVIAIIGILAGVVTVSVGNAQAKARDAKIDSDMSAISIALEMYYNDNGYYPTITSPGLDNCSGFHGNKKTSNTFFQPLVAAGYLSTTISDPLNTDCGYQYWPQTPYSPNSQGYRVLFKYENKTNNDLNCYKDGGWSCIRKNYSDI